MKMKADQYDIKLKDVNMMNVLESHSRLLNSDDARQLAELRVKVMSMHQQMEFLAFKETVEQEDFEKTMEWMADLVKAKQ